LRRCWRNGAAALFLTIRIGGILLVSSFSSRVTLPMILNGPLAEHALQMREASDAQREAALNLRFGIAEKKTAVTKDVAAINGLKKQTATTPPEIVNEQRYILACFDRYGEHLQALMDSLTDPNDARDLLSSELKICTQARTVAQAHLAQYRNRIAAQLKGAQTELDKATTELNTAQTAVDTRTDEARTVETSAITTGSSTVIRDLIATDWGFLVDVALFTLFQIFVETLPYTLKSLAGRSATGARIGAQREIEVIKWQTRLRKHRRETQLCDEVDAIASVAAREALRSKDVTQYFAEYFRTHMKAMAPTLSALQFLHHLQEMFDAMTETVSITPDLAGTVSELRRQVVKDTVEILKAA